MWSDAFMWSDGFVSNTSTATMAINTWVDQESAAKPLP